MVAYKTGQRTNSLLAENQQECDKSTAGPILGNEGDLKDNVLGGSTGFHWTFGANMCKSK